MLVPCLTFYLAISDSNAPLGTFCPYYVFLMNEWKRTGQQFVHENLFFLRLIQIFDVAKSVVLVST